VVGPLAEEGSLEGKMVVAFLLALLTFITLFAYLLTERYSLRRQESQVERLLYSHA
jgi:cytochrome c-type biogenesis protein CcmH/NrfG